MIKPRRQLGFSLRRSLGGIMVVAVFSVFSISTAAQRIAVLTPDNSETSREVAAAFSDDLARHLKVIDASVAESAYLSVSPAMPFNLNSSEARRIGQAIGLDFFVVLRAATQRRSALSRADYFETYAPIFVFGSRTGRLIFWKLQRSESARAADSRKLFDSSLVSLADEVIDVVKKAIRSEIDPLAAPAFEEPPAENTPGAQGFRAPVPFRRLKPEYTTEAAIYEVTATVDLIVYLDATGKVVRTDLERGAGFGLDESVEKNIRSMNWRPAERDGKPVAMKFLVRYNFKKPDKE